MKLELFPNMCFFVCLHILSLVPGIVPKWSIQITPCTWNCSQIFIFYLELFLKIYIIEKDTLCTVPGTVLPRYPRAGLTRSYWPPHPHLPPRLLLCSQSLSKQPTITMSHSTTESINII